MVKNLPAVQETQARFWVGKIRWRREWLPTPVFSPGEFHGQRRLVGYSSWGHKKSQTQLNDQHFHFHGIAIAAHVYCELYKL